MIYSLDVNQIHLLSHEEIKSAVSIMKQWRSILLSRKTVDRIKAFDVMDRVYKSLKLLTPPLIFSTSVTCAIETIEREYPTSNISPFAADCNNYQPLILDLFYLVLESDDKGYLNQSDRSNAIGEILVREQEVFQRIYYGVFDNFCQISEYHLSKIIDHEFSFINICYVEYCIEKFNLNHNPEVWNVFQSLIQECPYLIPLSKFCIIIERPIEIHLDNEGLPHDHNQPAMIFGDDSKVYYHHGIPFSNKYGEVPINDWQPEWILLEETYEEQSILTYAIGYKRFRDEYPEVDFWQEYDRLFYDSANRFLCESVDIIINWQLYHYNQLYLKYLQTDDLKINPDDAVKIIDTLPFKLPTELSNLYHYYNGGYQLTPGLHFYPLKQAIQALPNLTWIKSDTGYPFPLFKGTRDEIYYVLADDPEPTYCHVYCQFPDAEPVIYAECVTSLIVTIAQCYQEGAYYIAIDEETGDRSIEQDLDKIEPIFEKFNPDQIDNWRKIWKS
jgi:hypothetical protein